MFATAGMVGCKKDWLDVNDDPETTANVDPEFLLYGAQTEFSTNRTAEIGLSGAMWSQMWSSGQAVGVFANPERYIFSPFTTGNTWRTHYPNSQKNLKFAVEIAESSNPAKPNIAAQARVMRVLTYYTTTILWGDIPYSESINEDIGAPKFDPQEEVLNGLLSDLDVAINQFDASDPNVADDHYFSGDVTKWVAFAKSLKFRILMLMVDRDPSKSTDIITMLSEGGMMEQGGDAEFGFYNESGHANPNWNVINTYNNAENDFYYVSEVTYNTMEDYNDPRIPLYFTPGDSVSTIIPVGPGKVRSPDSTATISLNVIKAEAPERVFTYTEQLFLEAEAEYRFGSVANGDLKLRSAIRNSMEYWGVAEAEITTYLASIPALGTLTNDEALKLIGEQSWISNIDRPIEAWTNWRRLEYPRLSVPVGANLGGLVRRLPYPPDEISANPNRPTNIPQSDEPLWFDIPTSNP